MGHRGGRRGHFGAWRLLCAAPAALLSAMLATTAFSWLLPYPLLAVACWLLLAPLLLLTRPAERLAVRTAYRFRTPTGGDAEWLAWLQLAVENRCNVPPGHIDWYIRGDPVPNAFAAGHHSVAVTTGFLRLVYAGTLTPDQAVAVAVHEAGHHATRGARYGLAAGWLSWPWRTVYRTASRLDQALPYPAIGVLLPLAFVVAVFNVVRSGGPPGQVVPVLIALVTVGLAVIVTPVLDAAFTRASEHAADAYAAGLGVGPDLAVALQYLSPCRPGTLLGRARHTHPATDARQRRLIDATPSQGLFRPASADGAVLRS
jgi:Zn-dependent protease with chaperone function